MNVPQLRFDGFEGEWTSGKIGDFITHMVGGASITPDDYILDGIPTIPKKGIVSGGILNLNGNQLYVSREFQEKYPTSNINNEFLVTTLRDLVPSAPSMGYIVRIPETDKRSFVLSQGVYGFKVKSIMSEGYLIAFSNTQKYRRIIQFIKTGSTQVHIRNNEFLNIKILYPPLKEQEKVASFFDLFDRKLSKQKEKIEKLNQFKKGMMQKVFSQELRFKDEDGGEFPEWELNVKAKELFKSISNKNHAGDLPVLSASQEKGIVMRDSNNIQIQFSVDNLGNYKKVEPNDFVISLRSFQGGIEHSQLLGIMSPAYTIFRAFDEEKIYSPYFSFLFKTTDFITRLNNLTYGIRDGKAISFTDFSSMIFNVPSLQEQKKIANYLMNIDKKIEKEKEKLMILEEQKRGFMQGMFV